MLRYCLTGLIIFFCLTAFADDRIQQLLQIVSQDKKDARQVDAMCELAENFAASETEKALEYARKAEKLAKQIGYLQGRAKAFEVLGTIYAFQQQKHDDAAEYFTEAYNIYHQIYQSGKLNKQVLYDFITKKIIPAYQLIANKSEEDLPRRTKRAIKIYKNLQGEFTPVLAEIAALREQELRKKDTKLDSAQSIIESKKNELLSKEEELKRKEAELQTKNQQLSTNKKQQFQLARLNIKLGDSLRRSSDSLKSTMDSLNQLAAHLKVTTETLMLHEIRLQQAALKALEEKNRNMILEEEKRKQQRVIYFSLAALGVVMLFGFMMFRNYRIQKQLNKQLTEQRNELAQKNAEIEMQKEEIMAQNQNIMRQNAQIEAQRDKIHAKNQQILAGLNYASRIQSSMLPPVERIRQSIPEFFVFYKPRDVVGGDFYWFGQIGEGVNKQLILAAADCTGHGVPGGFMSIIGNKLLDEIIYIRNIHSPEKILNELHKGINKSLRQDETHNSDGMDIAICVIQPYQQQILVACAKNPVIYIQNEELREIKGDKLPIGGAVTEPRNYTLHTINITQPAMVYMFSDGLQDQFGGPEGKKFMLRNLRNKLVAICDKPIQEQYDAIATTMKKWMEGYGTSYKQTDDMMLLGFRVGGSPSVS
ncbi:MAG: SpoIIE family protein phosphatase [Cytophagales bacterium]|nr:SpoIIE family protein phosphatase [Bernardetiaceae bacterium]MDW8205846.1 SpoIIE family protein phosphatase [Cytophagales bacterium]